MTKPMKLMTPPAIVIRCAPNTLIITPTNGPVNKCQSGISIGVSKCQSYLYLQFKSLLLEHILIPPWSEPTRAVAVADWSNFINSWPLTMV